MPRRCVQIFRDPGSLDAVMHLAAESHVDRSIHGLGGCSSIPMLSGTFTMLEASRQYTPVLSPVRRATFRIPLTYPQTRCSARLAPVIRRSTRPTCLRSAQPLFGEQGSFRPSGAVRGSTPMVCPPRLINTRQQLRAVAPPGKADPADHAERAAEEASAGRMATARTGAIGSLSRTTRLRRRACPVNLASLARTMRSVPVSCAAISTWCARSARTGSAACRILPASRERLIQLRTDSIGLGMISATRSIRRAAETALGWTRAARLRDGSGADHRVVDLANRDWWGAGARRGAMRGTTVGN